MKMLRAMSADSRDALMLTVGRTSGFVVAFAIPLVLVRVLDQQEFGIYKYLFLISTTAAVLQLGLAESLYYFVPRAQRDAGRVIANAVGLLIAVSAGLVLIVSLAGGPIAALVGAAQIEPYLPLLAWFLAGLLVSMPLEIVMVSRRQTRLAAVTYAVSDVCRATLLVAPGIWTGSLDAILAGAVAFGVIRVTATGFYLLREFGTDLRPDRPWAAAQLAYATPFSVAVIIETVQLNLHQFVVWARFDPATFAIYAAGCLQIPIVDLLETSVGNVMMVRMADRVRSAAEMLRIWKQAVMRLARFLLPLVAALLLTAGDLIVVLFTRTYAASVPIFMVSTAAVALAVLPVDSALRAWAQTRFLIVMNLVRLAVVVIGISWALGSFGLVGGVLITVLGLAAAKAVAVWRIARTLEVGIGQVLPWRGLAAIAGVAAAAALPAFMLQPYLPTVPLLRGALTAAVYGLTAIALTGLVHVVTGRQTTAPGWLAGEERL